MRQTVVAIVFLLITVGVAAASWRNRSVRRRAIGSRPKLDLAALYEREFSDVDRQKFFQLWQALANKLEVEAEKMHPEDSIGILRPAHLSELYIDSVERFLESRGAGLGEVTLDTPIREIIRILVRRVG